MSFLNLFRRSRKSKRLPTVVVFAGGMGTQIIQAAAYFSLRSSGHAVFADLSYFDTEAKIAETGKTGELTHWFWQLDQFGLRRESFVQNPAMNNSNAEILRDGARMTELGLNALSQPDIRSRFVDATDIGDILPADVLKNFLCVHIRRGDYVNVASHLISDDEFVKLLEKFSSLSNCAVILSDSPIQSSFRDRVSAQYGNVYFFDDIDPYTSHRIMRRARILVCSNSTFSLTAAALNPNALVVIPKRWYAANDHELETPIQTRCSFQIMR